MGVKLLELLPGEDCPGWVVRIRQIDDFGIRGDLRGELGQIVSPMLVRDGFIAD
jgi:hypothetical protein